MSCPLVAALRHRPRVQVWTPCVSEWMAQAPPPMKSASSVQTATCPLVQALFVPPPSEKKTAAATSSSSSPSSATTLTLTPTAYLARLSSISSGKVDRLVFGTAMGTFKKAKDEDFIKAPPKADVDEIFEAGLGLVDAYHLWPALRHKKWWIENGLKLWIHARKYPQLCSVATACQYLYITWDDLFGYHFQFNPDLAMHIMGNRGFTLTEWHALGFSFSQWCEWRPERPPHVAWVRWMRFTCCSADVQRWCIEPGEWSDFLGMSSTAARDVMRLMPTDLCQCGNANHISTYLYQWMLVYPSSIPF